MRKLVFVFVSIFLLISKIGSAQVNLNLGLKAYYPFSGNANDASGNNNNAIFNNATLTADRSGNANSAYHFNGIDNYIRIANSTSLNPASNKISICAWVRPMGFYTGTCHGNSVVMKGDADYLPGNYNIRFDDNAYTHQTQCSNPVDIVHQNFYANDVAVPPPGYSPYIQPNQWYSVVYTNDGTTSKLYVNCELKFSGPAVLTNFTNTYDLFLGHLNSPAFPYWLNGDLDEVRIYDRAINQDEVNVYGGCTNTIACNNWLSTPVQPSYVDIGDLDIPGNKLTVEADINRTSFQSNGITTDGDIVSKHTGPPDANYILRPTGAIITTSNGFFATPPVCAIQLNKTYHCAMVYDGSTLKFYRNGFLMSQVNATGNLFQNNLHTSIGLLPTQNLNENFIGYINEVRIWNVARTQTELRTYMNTSLPSPATQTGLQAYYTFNDLLNKQGNAAWNGTLGGSASINAVNPNCTFIADSCNVIINTVTASFTAPDTVCVNTPVQVTNTSQNATTYYWNFCTANINQPPTGTNLGTLGGLLKLPVYIDYVFTNGNYYGFVTNNSPGGLLRLDFGNSLLNTPATTFLGTLGGAIPNNTEGIQIANDNGNWYLLIVGGDAVNGSIPSLTTVSLGPNIANNSPTATNWGNIGNLAYPHDLYVFNDNGHWYGLTVNTSNNTITRFDLTTSLSNSPSAVNLGNIGNLSGPTGIQAINDNGNWRVFITNATSSTLTRLDFGSSLLNNTPSGVNLGNPNNAFTTCWDIYILKYCGENEAFVINAAGNNDIVKLNFGNSLLNTPSALSLGNQGNLNFPHCLSKLFRVGPDVFSFVTNVNSNSLTLLKFQGCTTASIPNSTLQTPPAITYNTPGIYNINLTIDDGLPTQTSFCKQVVVKDCNAAPVIINDYTPVLALNPCNNSLTVEDGTKYNAGDTVLIIQMKGAVIDSTNTAAFGTVTDYKNAGNYEFNYVKSRTGNIIELKNVLVRQYTIPDGKVQLVRVPYYNSANITSTLTCLPWDGSKGGILVLNAKDSVTLNADIDVSGNGFQGAQAINTRSNNINCNSNNFYYPLTSILGAPKGESIANIGFNISAGKGSPGSAGGGGSDHNAGGGGGGNGGVGGFGGFQYDGCSNPVDNRGIGGKLLNFSAAANKIFLGGGGGAGHCNQVGGINLNGGNGGGIVLIKTPKLIPNSYRIYSNGANAVECQSSDPNICNDGSGGGGGGGTVLLDINQYSSSTISLTNGGTGASIHATIQTGRVGPGGGGGGGVTWVSQAGLPANLTPTSSGGTAGTIILDGNSNYGATAGQNGQSVFNLNIPVSSTPFKANIDSVRFNQTLTNCSHFDFAGLGYTNTSPIASWQWYFGDGGTATGQNTAYTYGTTGTFNVKLVITDINGCKDSIIKPVTPGAPAVANAGLDTAFCSNTAVTVTLHGNAGASSYAWSPTAPLNNSGFQNPTATISASTRFYLTVTNAAGCSGIDSVDIAVNALPVVRTLKDTATCKNSVLILTTTAGLANYHWSPGIYLNDSTIANPAFIDVVDRTLYITGTDANGCIGKDTINITVKPLPNVKTIDDTTICSTNTVTLFTNGAQTYSWTPIAELSDPNIANPIFSGTQGHTYYVTGTGANGCKANDTVKVTVNIPGTFKTPPDKVMCAKASVQLDGANGNTYSYLWSPGTYLTNINIINPVANPPYTATYNLHINDKVCNFGQDFKVQVTVDPLPFIDAAKSNDIDCAHHSAILTAYGLSYSYTWSPAYGLSSTTIATPIAKPASTQQYILTAKDSIGCTSKDSVTVYVKTAESLSRYMPNAFTPNGDGHNDCYGLQKWMYIKNLQFIIFDRWGEKVFSTNNQNDCWDGNYKGKPAVGGTYVFYIKAETECGTEEQKGNFILIR